MNSSIALPKTDDVEKQVVQLLTNSQNFNIVNHQDYTEAAEKLKVIKSAQSKVKALFDEPKKAAHRAHRAITEAENKLLDPLKRAENICSQKVSTYLFDLRKKEQEEFERQKRIAQEEAERVAKEQKLAQEEEMLKHAEMLSAQGLKEEADQILNQEVNIIPISPIIHKQVESEPKVEGVHLRVTYKAFVEDFSLLISEVAAGRQPTSLLLPNEKVLNGMATALKSELRIPGVKIIENASTTTRSNFIN